jgi:glycosyltransferase involved in cell wall biosynthesis
LIIIPSKIAPDTHALTAQDARPQADYYALQSRLDADILDAGALESKSLPALVRLSTRLSISGALALLAYSRRKDYDIMFSNAENIGIPLALLLRLSGRSPVHAMIGHRLSAGKKRLLLRAARSRIHCVFVYSELQRRVAAQLLNPGENRLLLIPFHADQHFFRPMAASQPGLRDIPTICSAGLEWRDYPTLLRAVDGLNVNVHIGAHSPWSRQTSGIDGDGVTLPPNVCVKQYGYAELRSLYSESAIVVVPLKQNDFQAGITVILEAMAMGRPVITTQTAGMAPGLISEENCLLTPAGDAQELRSAITRLLENPAEAEHLGARGRETLLNTPGMTLEGWATRIADTMIALVKPDTHLPKTAAAGNESASAERKSS